MKSCAEAAVCVQVLTSQEDIEMWGDGLQTRSFTFIDDCVEGILRITKSDFKEPLNLGSSEMVRLAGGGGRIGDPDPLPLLCISLVAIIAG